MCPDNDPLYNYGIETAFSDCIGELRIWTKRIHPKLSLDLGASLPIRRVNLHFYLKKNSNGNWKI